MNLGQSQFQDTFFVAGAQHTPYRRLRQIELELHTLNDNLKQSNFSIRRLKLKIEKLNPQDPFEAIDIEEAHWELEKSVQLMKDAENRKKNFELMKEQLLSSVPQEYWDQGFENAECEYWVKYIAKQISVSKALGLPPSATVVDMWLQLPESAQYETLVLSNSNVLQLQNLEQKALLETDK